MSAQYSLAIHLIIPVRTARPQPGLGPALTHGPEPTRAAEPCPPGMAPPPHCLLQVPTPRGKGPPGAPCRALPPSPSHRAQGLFNGAGRSGTETSAPAAYSGPQSKPRLWRWGQPHLPGPQGESQTEGWLLSRRKSSARKGLCWRKHAPPQIPKPLPLPLCPSHGEGSLLPPGELIPSPDKRPLPLLMGARHWFSEP